MNSPILPPDHRDRSSSMICVVVVVSMSSRRDVERFSFPTSSSGSQSVRRRVVRLGLAPIVGTRNHRSILDTHPSIHSFIRRTRASSHSSHSRQSFIHRARASIHRLDIRQSSTRFDVDSTSVRFDSIRRPSRARVHRATAPATATDIDGERDDRHRHRHREVR